MTSAPESNGRPADTNFEFQRATLPSGETRAWFATPMLLDMVLDALEGRHERFAVQPTAHLLPLRSRIPVINPADINKLHLPVVLVETGEPSTPQVIADGHHRLQSRVDHQLSSTSTYTIPADIAERYRLTPDEFAQTQRGVPGLDRFAEPLAQGIYRLHELGYARMPIITFPLQAELTRPRPPLPRPIPLGSLLPYLIGAERLRNAVHSLLNPLPRP
ncbi:hypothetical protein [Deinococcus ruber]|uniref:ParB/Sulfiredoxin domain-containing protein n=1 Tax=Deinococcus ruber TaxID=1848197 RepID=A0A918CCF4_9DEIO|nr:hypothetical protein [Deinococcus ruber]GGR17349.1 hypothetical protein GCM10008957_32500 [Deinococcus ruber]